MKKKFCLLTAILIIATITFCSCGGDSEKSSDSTAKATDNVSATTLPAQNTNGIIVATQAPTQAPTKDPDGDLSYVDLILDNKYLTFSASSTEGEDTPEERGPELCFDDDDETRWSSVFYDVEGSWICVEFGYPVIINGVYINENQTWGTMLKWEAQYYSESKQEWVTAYEGDTSYPDEYYEFDKNTEETYAFRLYFLEGSGTTITINEIDLEGVFVEVPEGTEPKKPNNWKNPEHVIPEGVSKLSGDWTYAASSIEGEELIADYAFDGDETTRWGSEFNGLYEAWISVDFRSTVTISGFIVKEASQWGHVTSYSAQIMENGEWKTVYSGERFNSGFVALDKPVSTTQFRLLVHDGQTLSETVSIYEIEIYG